MDIPRIAHRQWDEDFDLIPSFGRYGNGRLALQLYGDDGPFATISVNMVNDFLPTDDVMFVKDYAENEQIVQTLLEAGWLVPIDQSARPAGFTQVSVMRLAGPLLSWYDSLDDAEIS